MCHALLYKVVAPEMKGVASGDSAWAWNDLSFESKHESTQGALMAIPFYPNFILKILRIE
jgi:hypothetical protein